MQSNCFGSRAQIEFSFWPQDSDSPLRVPVLVYFYYDYREPDFPNDGDECHTRRARGKRDARCQFQLESPDRRPALELGGRP